MKKFFVSLPSFLVLLVIFLSVKGDFDDDQESSQVSRETSQEDPNSWQTERESDKYDGKESFKSESDQDSHDIDETSTSQPNIFVYLPYRPRTTTSRSLTPSTLSPTKWTPKSSITSLRNWTPSPAKELINRSSNLPLDSSKFQQQSSETASGKTFSSVKTSFGTTSPQKAKLETSQSAVSYVQQSPVSYVQQSPVQYAASPPQQNVVVVRDQPRQFVQAPPTVVHQPPLVVQSPPVQQQIVQYAPPSPQPAHLVQAPQQIQYIQEAPPQPEPVQFIQDPPVQLVQAPPVQVLQAPPVQVLQAPPVHFVQAPPAQVLRAPPPCPPLLAAPPAFLQTPPRQFLFAPPPPPPLVLFAPPRPVRTRTVYTQVEQVPVQTHVQTTTHFSPATRTIVYDSLGSNPRPVFAPKPYMFPSASKMMPLMMPPESMESMEWMPPPSKPPKYLPPTSTTKKPPSIDTQGILGAGGLVSTIGGRVLGTLAEKYFEREEKRKKKKVKYRGHKILLKALIKRKP